MLSVANLEYLRDDSCVSQGRISVSQVRASGTDLIQSHHTDTDTDTGQPVPALLMFMFVGCLTSQQHASVSQGRVCSDSFTCCHTEIEVAYQTFYLIQSQYTDTGPTSPSTDPITPRRLAG